MRLALASLAAAVAAGLAGAGDAAPAVGGSISPIGPALRAQMTGRSWHAGCPVPIAELRLLSIPYWGFDGKAHAGQLVVNRDVATAVLGAMRRLYAAHFPIRRMRLVDAYGGDDFRSIEADNTSAFNCRPATGSSHWSEHAYGHAIDIDPIENPYVSGGATSHTASRQFLDRSQHRAGMAYSGGTLVETFRAIGWGWGGSWAGSIKDYQHFSASGR
jgi:D-alanyl-D-alanine carboxypeptidase-like protein